MTSISNFDSSVYSEELFNVTESKYDEVMQMMAVERDDFAGYSNRSASLEADQIEAESDNFRAYKDGRVEYKGKNLKGNRVGGIEI